MAELGTIPCTLESSWLLLNRMDNTRQPGLLLSQVFLESASFQHRHDFLSLPASPPPGEIQVVLEAQYMIAADGRAGVVRMVIKTDDATNPHYGFEVIVAATISVEEGAENMSIEEYVRGGAGRALLYPFAREAVANLTGRGRFGPLWLHPFNFIAAGVAEEPSSGVAVEAVSRANRLAKRKKSVAKEPR